jgi:hypothetical protein
LLGAFAAVALAGLAGCQSWAPAWSEVSGARYNVANLNRYPTVINLVDGQNPGPRQGYGGRTGYTFYKLEPGKHTIELSAVNTTPNWVSGINLQNFTLDVEPCKRYYINADFTNPLLADWKPVVDYAEPIPGCAAAGGAYK